MEPIDRMAQVKQRKVALMGFRSVGKSSLAIQFVQVREGLLALYNITGFRASLWMPMIRL